MGLRLALVGGLVLSSLASLTSPDFDQPEIVHHIPHNTNPDNINNNNDEQPEYVNTNNAGSTINRQKDLLLQKSLGHVSPPALVTTASNSLFEDPEFLPRPPSPLPSHAVPPRIEASSHMVDVQDYVPTHTALLEMKPIRFMQAPASKGDMRTIDSVQSHLSPTGSSDLYLDASLTDDLENDVKNAATNERFLQRSSTPKKVSVAFSLKPEAAPPSLPKHLAGVFQQLAEKYERNFQSHFQDSLPHPASYLGVEERPRSQHSYQYTHFVSSEPQILLPVPAGMFLQSAASQFQREHLIREALSAEARRVGLRSTIDGNNAVLMEVGSQTTPAAPVPAGGTGAAASPAPGFNNFIDPFPAMTPAALVAGYPQAGLGWTPASLSAWGPAGFDGAGLGGFGGAYPYGGAVNSNGMMGGGLSPMMNPATNGSPARIPSQDPNFPVVGVYSMGVRSPPPPLRPDNLPPPPYISPLVVSSTLSDVGTAAGTIVPPK